MSIPTSMGANKLDVRKGDRNSIIDYTGILAAAVSIPAGYACSLNASGLLVPGIDPALSAGPKVGAGVSIFFAWSGTDPNNYPDVTRVGLLSGALNAQTRDSVAALGVGGIAMPYAGAARFGTISVMAEAELSSTGVVSTQTYVPGTLLTAIGVSASAALRGLIRPVAAETDIVIGVVAPAGLYTSPDGYPTLAFYPTFIPGTTAPTTA
jgi:hypothetical protein